MLMNQFLSNPRPRASRLDFIRRVWRDHELSCVKLCDLLEESFRMKDHVEAGCGRFDDFAENEFGVPARQAWTFVHLGQRLVELPETRKALLYGIIGYTKARADGAVLTFFVVSRPQLREADGLRPARLLRLILHRIGRRRPG